MKAKMTQKIVGHAEALQMARTLRWRMDFLEENGVKGADFLAEIQEELQAAQAMLERKFTGKAQELNEMIKNRVARIKAYAFDSVSNQNTIH